MCAKQNKTITFGYAIARTTRPWECPEPYAAQRPLCEPPSVQAFLFRADGSPVVPAFATVVSSAAAQYDNVVVFTVASYDFAEDAALWYHALAGAGIKSGVVVASDWGALKYLVNRQVA